MCRCLITPGTGILVRGSGQATDPYVVSTTPALAGGVQTVNTATVKLSTTGSGTGADPYVIAADATLHVLDLIDVEQDALNIGDTLSWDGTQWVTAAPPVAPAGATNTAGGLAGSGAVDNPVRANVSGVWGTAPLDEYGSDSTIGQPIYVDVNGQLRTAPLDTAGLSVPWSRVSGKPSVFASSWSQVSGKPTSFPASWTTVTGRPKILAGRVWVPALAPGASWTGNLDLTAGGFTEFPALLATNAYANVAASTAVTSLKAGRVVVYNQSGSPLNSVVLSWLAIQQPPTA